MSLSTWVNACCIGGIVVLVAALHCPDTVTPPPVVPPVVKPVMEPVTTDHSWSGNVARIAQDCVMDAMVFGIDDEEIEAVFGYCLYARGVTI